MDTILKLAGWQFSVNKESTENYYKNNIDLCECDYCKNFYANVELLPEDVKSFIKQFGVDIAKPIEQESIIADKINNMVEVTIYYAVTGVIIKSDTSDIKIGTNCLRVVPRELMPNTDISEPYFVFEVSNIWIPWTISEKIDIYYPKEKSFNIIEFLKKKFGG